MALFNHATKEVTAKVVYYGPGLCGKTTNLQWIHDNMSFKTKGKLVSLATQTDRTLFFDFLPVELGTIRGMRTRMQIYTVPGQVFYEATRRMVLKGCDAVVFVADSQAAMLDADAESLRSLHQNLLANEIDPAIPHVMQYNKRDLATALPVSVLNARLNPRNLPYFEAVAVRGTGVEETLKGITKLLFNWLARFYGEGSETAAATATAGIVAAEGTPAPAAVTVRVPHATLKFKPEEASSAEAHPPVATPPPAPVRPPAAVVTPPPAPVKPPATVVTPPPAPVTGPGPAVKLDVPPETVVIRPQRVVIPGASQKPTMSTPPALPSGLKFEAPRPPAPVGPLAPVAPPAPVAPEPVPSSVPAPTPGPSPVFREAEKPVPAAPKEPPPPKGYGLRADQWLYLLDGKQKGPVDVEDLVDLVLTSIPEDTKVWHPGLEGWVRASEVREIAEEIPPPLPTPGARGGYLDEDMPDFNTVPAMLRSVLIADEDAAFRKYLAMPLAAQGFTIYEAADGSAAWQLAVQNRPWMILADVSMPEVDGFEFCRRVRTHPLLARLPLLFISGSDKYKERYRALQIGADDFLTKSTPIRELLMRIQLLMTRYSDLSASGEQQAGVADVAGAFQGRIEVFGAPALLQMCSQGRLTGLFTALAEDAAKTATVMGFREGDIISATAGAVTGAEGVYAFLAWEKGSFKFTPGDPGEGAPLAQSVEHLLLEGCRLLDESRKDDDGAALA
jgi:CheY-like chemotaxis protein/signal recognition particle receptor subunit beta